MARSWVSQAVEDRPSAAETISDRSGAGKDSGGGAPYAAGIASTPPPPAVMNVYLVRRLGIAGNARSLDAALMRLRAAADRPAPRCRVLQSYALQEADGRFGLACVVEGASVLDVHEHAWSSELPVDEVVRVTATRVERAFAPALVHLVRRRGGWADAGALERSIAAVRAAAAADAATRVAWLHSHAVLEADGRFGTFCFYQSSSPQALREHAARLGLVADEIVPVLGRVVFAADSHLPVQPGHAAGTTLASG